MSRSPLISIGFWVLEIYKFLAYWIMAGFCLILQEGTYLYFTMLEYLPVALKVPHNVVVEAVH